MKRPTLWIAIAAVVLLGVLAWIATADHLWGEQTPPPASSTDDSEDDEYY